MPALHRNAIHLLTHEIAAEIASHGSDRVCDRGARVTSRQSTLPMFGGRGQAPLFTTIFFLDFGKNSANAMDGCVFAYGLDNNWRSQRALYLARVPANSVQTRSAWQFYTGTDTGGNPLWTANIMQKRPVLIDTRLLYPVMFGTEHVWRKPEWRHMNSSLE